MRGIEAGGMAAGSRRKRIGSKCRWRWRKAQGKEGEGGVGTRGGKSKEGF